MDKREVGGISVLIGNAALFANGLIAATKGAEGDIRKAGIGRMSSAIGWSGGGIILARYGHQSVPDQFAKLQNKLAAYLQKEGVPLDAETLRKADAHIQRGWFRKLEDFLYDYPIECTNAYYAVASAGMIASGIIRRRGSAADIQSGNANLATSALILVGTLASILIPERTKEQIAQHGDQGTIIGKIEERPLNYAVWAYLASDLSIGSEALGEWARAKEVPKDSNFKSWAYAMPVLSAFAMSCMLLGDTLTGFSSKKAIGTVDERNAAKEKILEQAINIIAAQPPQTQSALIKSVSEYLAHQPELRMTDEIAERLAQELQQRIENAADLAQGAFTQRLQSANKNAARFHAAF